MKPALNFVSIETLRKENELLKSHLDAYIKIEKSTKEYKDTRFERLMKYRWAYDYFRNHTKMNILDIMNTSEYKGDGVDFNVLDGLLTLQEFIDSANSKNYLKITDEITIALDISSVDSFDLDYKVDVLKYFERIMIIISQFDVEFRFNIEIIYSEETQNIIENNEEFFEVIVGLSNLENVTYKKMYNDNEVTWCLLKSSALSYERKQELFKRYLKLIEEQNNDKELLLEEGGDDIEED